MPTQFQRVYVTINEYKKQYNTITANLFFKVFDDFLL